MYPRDLTKKTYIDGFTEAAADGMLGVVHCVHCYVLVYFVGSLLVLLTVCGLKAPTLLLGH